MAYDFLHKKITASDYFEGVEIQKRNVETIADLEDAIDFYNADLYILDANVEGFEELLQQLKSRDLPFEVISGEVREIIPLLEEKYGQVKEEKPIYYEREQVEQVIIQEKIIEKEIFVTNYQAIPSKVVVVGSLYRGAGSTVLATNMARMIAKRGVDVAYVEHPSIQPYMFDYLQIHANEEIKYHDIAREVKEHGVVYSKGETYKRGGVKWHVIDSRKPSLKEFSYENLMTLSYAIQSTVIIIDISDQWLDEGIKKFLYMADSILLCIEPDPIKNDLSLISREEENTKEKNIMDFLNQTEQLNHYQYVLMKNVEGIDSKLIKGMLHKRPVATMPYLDYEDIKKALFKSELLYDTEDYNLYFEKNLIQVLTQFVPKDFLNLEDKKKFLGKFFRK